MSDEELKSLVTKLQNGTDSRVDMMYSWIAIENYRKTLDFIRKIENAEITYIEDAASDFLKEIGE